MKKMVTEWDKEENKFYPYFPKILLFFFPSYLN